VEADSWEVSQVGSGVRFQASLDVGRVAATLRVIRRSRLTESRPDWYHPRASRRSARALAVGRTGIMRIGPKPDIRPIGRTEKEGM